MTSFAETFRALVVPRIAEEIKRQAFLLAMDSVSYSDAFARCLDVGARAGAYRLPTPIFDDLLEWIGSRLVQEDDKLQRIVSECSARADRVASQFAAFEACRE